jgi:MFS family permease
VPYLLRALALAVTLVVAYVAMRDWGFAPRPSKRPVSEMRQVLRSSLRHGLGNPPVRWVMLSALFVNGVVLYAAYAMQPYLLDLYGDERAYSVAGLAAAIFAGAQIAGGMLAPRVRKLFRRRTSVLLAGTLLSAGLLALLGVNRSFWVAIAMLLVWGLGFAATMPVRQAYMNGLIPSEQRATVLSFDNMLSSGGGVVAQPALGKAADVWSYHTSYLVGAAIQLVGAPLVVLARRERPLADVVEGVPTDGATAAAEAPTVEAATGSREVA